MSVGRSVGRSVGWSVGWSVGRSVGRSVGQLSVTFNILQCLSCFHLVFVQLDISLLYFLAKRVQVFRSVQLLYTCNQSKQYIYKLGNGLLWIKYGSPFPSLYTALFYNVMSSAVKLGHSTLDQTTFFRTGFADYVFTSGNRK